MRWFKNLKISVKLATGFFVITSLTVVVGVVGLFGMRQVDNAIEYVSGQSLSLFYLAGANDNLQRARISVRDMVLGAVADDRGQIESAFASIAANMALIDNHFIDFSEVNMEADIQNAIDSGRLLYENELIPIVQSIFEASIEGDVDKALALLEECIVVSDAIIAFFDHGMELGLGHAGNVTAYAHGLTDRSFLLITAILIIAVLLSLLLALCIASIITSSIKSLMRLAEEISGGNLRPNFPEMPKDETGMLARSFGNMSMEIFLVLEAIQQKSKSIALGKLNDAGAVHTSKGDLQQILDDVVNMEQSFCQYLDGLQCAILIIDSEYRLTFVNAFATGQGYDITSLRGKTVFEFLLGYEAKAISDSIDKIKSTGELVSYQIETVTPKGEVLIVEQTIVPIIGRKKAGITTFILSEYEITKLVKAQKISEKINTYQEFESGDLSKKLLEGLSQGLLRFDFELEPHDEDTAAAAATYRLISDTIKNSLAFIKSYVDEITKMLGQIANKDFDIIVDRDYIGDFSSIKESIVVMTESISTLIINMQDTADGIDCGTERVALSMQELMASFDSQITSMSNIKGAANKLSDKTLNIVNNTDKTKTLSSKMQIAAQAGSRQMDDLSATMAEIKNVSTKTTQIAKTVEEIAFQTNLLALNAAVEAARAGEHGRGFSIVAEEVRSLANRSAVAAKETAELLDESQTRISGGEVITGKTSEAFKDILEITDSVANLISEVAAASEEQAEELNNIRHDLSKVFGMIEEDTNVVQTNASELEELSAYASVLNVLLKQFNTKKVDVS